MPNPILSGAVEQWLEQHLFGGFVVRRSVVSVGTSVVQAVPNDPERTMLIVVNRGTTVITLDVIPGVVANTGIILGGQGVTMTAQYDEDGPLVTAEFNAVGSAAGGSIYVLEVRRERPGPIGQGGA